MSRSHSDETRHDIEVLNDFYQQFLDRLWNAISELLGNAATAALFHAARWDKTKDHPFLADLVIQEDGVRLPFARAVQIERNQLIQAYLDYVESLQYNLQELTGESIASRLDPLIAEFKFMMARGKHSGTRET